MSIEVVVGGRLSMRNITPGHYHKIGQVDPVLFERVFTPEVDGGSLICDPARVVYRELRARGCTPRVIPSPNRLPNIDWMKFYFMEVAGVPASAPFLDRYLVAMLSPIGHDHRRNFVLTNYLTVFGAQAVPAAQALPVATGLLAVGDELLRRQEALRSRLPQPSVYIVVGRDFSLLAPPFEDKLYARLNVKRANVPTTVREAIAWLPPLLEVKVISYAPLGGLAQNLAQVIAAPDNLPIRMVEVTGRPPFVVGDRVIFLDLPDAVGEEVCVVEVVDDLVFAHRIFGTGPILAVDPRPNG